MQRDGSGRILEEVFDLIVVGSGAAGLSVALRAAELGARVVVLTGGPALAGSSPRAQGGVAAAIGSDDTAALHAGDTHAVGAGLNDAAAVDVLTAGGRDLLRYGLPFERDLGLEAGHIRRRILHAGGGATGHVLIRTLLERVTAQRRIAVREQALVTRLVRVGNRVAGVRSTAGGYWARAVVLATGGYAALWGRSTNPPETRGQGLSLAWKCGASLADLEFVQFHPTALNLPDRPAFLLSEALRGEGALIVDGAGDEVVDPLLPRDVVARAIHRHVRERGPVFLSLRHLDADRVRDRFRRLAQVLRADFGLDLAGDALPVAPAAHYCMGGIRTDVWCRTDVAGLYAAGEVACTGAQGANRLASNSLLECLVFGARAAEAALSDERGAAASWQTSELNSEPSRTGPPDDLAARLLGSRLDGDVGVERDGDSLRRLIGELPEPEHAQRSEVLLASSIARAAWLRAESRGAHFRADAPDANPGWRGRIHWRRGQRPRFESIPTRTDEEEVYP